MVVVAVRCHELPCRLSCRRVFVIVVHSYHVVVFVVSSCRVVDVVVRCFELFGHIVEFLYYRLAVLVYLHC